MGGRIPKHVLERLNAEADLVRIVESAGVVLKKRGSEYWGLCPVHDEKSPSFKVDTKRQRAKCFACDFSWDAIECLEQLHGKTFREAVEYLGGAGELSPVEIERDAAKRKQRERADAKERAQRTRDARGLWAAAAAHDCGPVEAYLLGRGITVPVPASIRFYPRPAMYPGDQLGERWPAMVSAVRLPDGSLTAVHLTYLNPNGWGKAPAGQKTKRLFGSPGGGSVMLGTGGDPFHHLSEGIETGFKVMQRLGLKGLRACLSTSGLKNVVLPDTPKNGVIWADLDRVTAKTGKRPGTAAAEAAITRLNAMGYQIEMVLPQMQPGGKADFDDVWT